MPDKFLCLRRKWRSPSGYDNEECQTWGKRAELAVTREDFLQT